MNPILVLLPTHFYEEPDFAPWNLVYYYFRKWKNNGTFEEILSVLVGEDRKAAGRDESPSLGIIDSRSVKTSHHVDADRGIGVGAMIPLIGPNSTSMWYTEYYRVTYEPANN